MRVLMFEQDAIYSSRSLKPMKLHNKDHCIESYKAWPQHPQATAMPNLVADFIDTWMHVIASQSTTWQQMWPQWLGEDMWQMANPTVLLMFMFLKI